MIGHYLPDLKQRGDNWRGRCPYCDSSDGMSVSTEKNAFRCFSCLESGTAAWLLHEIGGMDYPDACDELGVEMSGEFEQTARKRKAKTVRQKRGETRQRCLEIIRMKRAMTTKQRTRWQVYGMTNPNASEEDRDRADRLVRGVENEVITQVNESGEHHD